MAKPKKPGVEPKRKSGRPSDFTQDLADTICERIANGESLRRILSDKGMPAMSAVFRWLASDPVFREQYARSRDAQADHNFDGLCDMADEPPSHKVDGTVDPGWVQHQKLRIDTRKWAISKLAPKKYGDRIATEITGKDGGPIETKDMTDNEKARRLLFALAQAVQQVKT